MPSPDVLSVFLLFKQGSEKVYVQHKIAERSFDVLSVLNSGACVYVCGAADMASEVRVFGFWIRV